MLKKIKLIINYFLPFEDFTHILQLDYYNYSRYLKQIFNPLYFKIFKRNLQKREKIKYTLRSVSTIILSYLIFLSILVFIIILRTTLINKFFLILVLLLLSPIVVLIANIPTLLLRLGYFTEIEKAKKKINQFTDLKIIAITGSYGKTTTKNILYELLKYNYKVQFIENNINTPIGIAKWVNTTLLNNTQILIVEMGALSKNVIKRSASITPPDYAIITELGDQHMDRFKTFNNLVNTKLEIFFLEKSKKYILSNVYKKIKFNTNISNLTIIEDQDIKEKYNINPDKIKKFNKGNLLLAIYLAKDLGISDHFIVDSINNIKLPNRRKNIIDINGYTVIDDSYNISLNTAKNSLSYAKDYSKENHKSLIVITGGIPESSTKIKKVNEEFGRILFKQDIIIILLSTVFEKFILRGIPDKKNVFNKNSMEEALQHVFKTYPKQEYIILMLPELSDLSY